MMISMGKVNGCMDKKKMYTEKKILPLPFLSVPLKPQPFYSFDFSSSY